MAENDDYEYAVQRTEVGHSMIVGDHWGSRTSADRTFAREELIQAAREDGGRVKYGTSFKVVKRRKAGPVEDA